jgi:hypothetical protein
MLVVLIATVAALYLALCAATPFHFGPAIRSMFQEGARAQKGH